jgi:hypothetical protein
LSTSKDLAEMLMENYVTFAPEERTAVAKIKHVPWPFPDHKSRRYHYLPADKSPTNNRFVNDYLARTQLKKAYISGEYSLEDPISISNFSRQFMVSKNVLLTILSTKKKIIAEASAKAKKKYEGYDWNAMFNYGSLTKQTVAVLDKYLRHHKLHSASNKKAKLSAVQRHITHQLTATSQTVEREIRL